MDGEFKYAHSVMEQVEHILVKNSVICAMEKAPIGAMIVGVVARDR